MTRSFHRILLLTRSWHRQIFLTFWRFSSRVQPFQVVEFYFLNIFPWFYVKKKKRYWYHAQHFETIIPIVLIYRTFQTEFELRNVYSFAKCTIVAYVIYTINYPTFPTSRLQQWPASTSRIFYFFSLSLDGYLDLRKWDWTFEKTGRFRENRFCGSRTGSDYNGKRENPFIPTVEE